MKKIVSVLILSSLISGCSLFKEKPEIPAIPVEKPKLDISLPDPVKMQPIEWVVITDKNFQQVIEKYKENNNAVFLVALDQVSFKNLAINNANILKFIREQKIVIASYKKYYEK